MTKISLHGYILASFPGSPRARTKNAFLSCKRWKAGWGLGTRLGISWSQCNLF